MLIGIFFCGFAQSSKETGNVNLAVMQGPTGFSSAMLPSYIKTSVYPSPNEAVAKIVNGELDFAVLPANTVAVLYNKGVKIRAVAIVGEGMLSVVGSDETAKTIAVPGAGGTPDHMAVLLYPESERSYSIAAPAQLAQMVIAGKCAKAILPQPFVSMVTAKNPNVKIIDDVQKRWKEKTGFGQYPMSILVVREDFAEKNAKVVNEVKKDYAKSVNTVLTSVHDAALKIEEIGIMKADLAEGAIKDCAIVFKDGKKAETELKAYYDVLINLAPQALGGKMPADPLYHF